MWQCINTQTKLCLPKHGWQPSSITKTLVHWALHNESEANSSGCNCPNITQSFEFTLYWTITKINFVQSNFIFATSVWLVSKSIHFALTFMIVLCVTILANVNNCIDYIMTNPYFNRTCTFNLWLKQVYMKIFMKSEHRSCIIGGCTLMVNNHIVLAIIFVIIHKWLHDTSSQTLCPIIW
jgi:hypothetical protein